MPVSRRDALTKILLQSGMIIAGDALLSGFDFTKSQEKMLTRKIPRSNEALPVVGLGTWQSFDVGNTDAERQPLKEVLRIFVDAGGSVIDSSPMYARSEQVIGDLSQELSLRSQLFMATKVWTPGKQNGIEQMNSSFQKMKVSTMDLMQVHNLVDVREHLKTLKAWKEQGKIKYIGITHYTTAAYPELIRLIKEEKPDFVQFNYNIKVREAEKELLPAARDHGTAVIINRPFEEGDLFSLTKGKELPAWSAEFNIKSWAQYFLKYILSHRDVTCTIPGTSKPHHMKDNVAAGFGEFPDNAMRKKMVEYLS